jgi:deoxyribonuclease-1
MHGAYPGHGIISGKNRKLFDAWSAQDPVDRWECERARLIQKLQRNENTVVTDACRRAGM